MQQKKKKVQIRYGETRGLKCVFFKVLELRLGCVAVTDARLSGVCSVRCCSQNSEYLVYWYTTFAVSSPSRTKHGAVRTGLRTKTARSRDLLEKLTVTHLVSFPAFYATQRFIIVFSRSSYLPWSIQSTPSHTASQDSVEYYSPLFAEVKLRTGGSLFEFWPFLISSISCFRQCRDTLILHVRPRPLPHPS